MSQSHRGDPAVPPSVERMVRSQEIADEYDAEFADNPLLGYDHRVLTAWFDRPGRLLDLGCGTGRSLTHFGRRGFEVTGLDLSPRMLELSRAKCREAGLSDVLLIEGSIADLPMSQLRPPYDYAICMFATLGLVKGRENHLRAIRQAGEVLRPGGQYVFHVQNLFYNSRTLHLPWILTGLARWLVGRGELGDQVFWWYRGLKWMHMHAFRPKEIERLVREAGLELADLHMLNADCSGPLEARRLRKWRSRDFIVRCRKPGGTA